MTAFSKAAPAGDLLLTGDVTALEVEHDGAGTFTVLRGYDESHLLFRGRYTETYQNMTAADIAQKVAQRANLQPGQIDSTSPVFPYVSQNNSNDWLFLKKLAADVGYEVLVEDGKLHFRQPASSSDGPSAGSLTNTDDPLALTMGAHILRLRSVVTSCRPGRPGRSAGLGPVAETEGHGTASAGTSSASVGTNPSDLAEHLRQRHPLRRRCPLLQPDRGGHRRQGPGRPRQQRVRRARGGGPRQLKTAGGVAISLSLVGDPFDGKYTLTSVRHRYEPERRLHDRLHGERPQPALPARPGLGRQPGGWPRARRHRPSPAWSPPSSPT